MQNANDVSVSSHNKILWFAVSAVSRSFVFTSGQDQLPTDCGFRISIASCGNLLGRVFFPLAHDLLTDSMPQSYFYLGAELYNVHSKVLDCQFDTVDVDRTRAAKPGLT